MNDKIEYDLGYEAGLRGDVALPTYSALWLAGYAVAYEEGERATAMQEKKK